MSPAPGRTRRSKTVDRLGTVLFVLFLLVLSEAVLRWSGYWYQDDFRFQGTEDFDHEAGDLPFFLPDPELFWRLRPGSRVPEGVAVGERINAAGFRGSALDAAGDGLRIAVLGDAAAYGVGLAYPETYAAEVGERLTSCLGRPVEVINAAAPGYTSHQGLVMLRTDVLPLRPDVVTLHFGAWNDYTAAVGAPDGDKGRPAGSRWESFLGELRMLHVVEEARAVMAGPRASRDEYVKSFRDDDPPDGRRVPLDRFRTNLHAMIDLARSAGSVPIVIVPPLPGQTFRGYPAAPAYRAAVRQVATEAAVPVVDAAADLNALEDSGDWPYLNWIHPGRAGHRAIARSVVQAAAASLALPPACLE